MKTNRNLQAKGGSLSPLCLTVSLQVSESKGKVRTYFIGSMRSRNCNTRKERLTKRRSGARHTLAEVVFGLVQARNKEKMREPAQDLTVPPCRAEC